MEKPLLQPIECDNPFCPVYVNSEGRRKSRAFDYRQRYSDTDTMFLRCRRCGAVKRLKRRIE